MARVPRSFVRQKQPLKRSGLRPGSVAGVFSSRDVTDFTVPRPEIRDTVVITTTHRGQCSGRTDLLDLPLRRQHRSSRRPGSGRQPLPLPHPWLSLASVSSLRTIRARHAPLLRTLRTTGHGPLSGLRGTARSPAPNTLLGQRRIHLARLLLRRLSGERPVDAGRGGELHSSHRSKRRSSLRADAPLTACSAPHSLHPPG